MTAADIRLASLAYRRLDRWSVLWLFCLLVEMVGTWCRVILGTMADTKREEIVAAAMFAAREADGRLQGGKTSDRFYGVWRAAQVAAAEASHFAGDAFDDEIVRIADEVADEVVPGGRPR